MKPYKIMIRGTNWIGDAVMTTPAIQAVRNHFKDAHISLILRPWLAPLFEHCLNIDEVIPYPDDFKGVLGKIRFAKLIQSLQFDMAILFQNAIDAALIAWLARVPRRIGYNTDGRGLLLTTAIQGKRKNPHCHHVYYYLDLLKKALNIDYDSPELSLFVPKTERVKATSILSRFEPNAAITIGINPGATYGSAKRWLPERFAEAADRAVKAFNARIIIFGSEKEKPLAEQIAASMKSPALAMAGKTDLPLLAAMISACDVLATNDSGPMHIASALYTPLVAIFGSTNPTATGPFNPGYTIINKSLSCSPCLERECPKKDLKCMDAITPDDVFAGIERSLNGQKAVFLDRDGVIIKDAHYLNRFEDLHIFSGVAQALSRLKEAGFKLICITNQSGIARGIVDESFVRQCHAYLIEKLGIDAFYYCPHHPDQGCACRKPEKALLKKAKAQHQIDLRKSFMIGDKDSDLLLAKGTPMKGVLAQTGKEKHSPYADFAAATLGEAVDWILKQESV